MMRPSALLAGLLLLGTACASASTGSDVSGARPSTASSVPVPGPEAVADPVPTDLVPSGPVSDSNRASGLVAWPEPGEYPAQYLAFPEWSRSMRLWPFDILEPDMSNGDIDERIEAAVDEDATAIIFYIETEHMYATFVDEDGFAGVLEQIRHLTTVAGQQGLRTIVYLNGLEVMTSGAFDSDGTPTGIETMASAHPDWLQTDLDGNPIVYGNQTADWLEPDWEDAWISPFSGYRELFKTRIEMLASAGVDGIYVDATFLPGFQPDEDNRRWGTTDPGFRAAFEAETGLELPAVPDPEEREFREFLTFRHTAIADYLGELAVTARDNGLVAFWESSSNDTPEVTLLGNSTAVTGRQGLGFSPEIEPEGDYLAAFRMAKAARELNMGRPMIYLGWPESSAAADIEFAVTLAQSNTYYPTADIDVPDGAFGFMDDLSDIFDDRIPYSGSVALVYSDRNLDFTLENEAAFDSYVAAFEGLASRHIPHRIVPLEYVEVDGLAGVETVVLPGIEAISDGEVAAIGDRAVAAVGDAVATRDDHWAPRSDSVSFPNTMDLEQIDTGLPFAVVAPETTYIEYYTSRSQPDKMYLFVVSPDPGGELILVAPDGESLSVKTSTISGEGVDVEGLIVAIDLTSELAVVSVSR